jgi:hypothetical protein
MSYVEMRLTDTRPETETWPMTTFTPQPMSTFALVETAKRLLSSDLVRIQAENVVRTDMFDDDGRFLAVKFAPNGSATLGLWSPDADWAYPSDIRECEPGTFTPGV